MLESESRTIEALRDLARALRELGNNGGPGATQMFTVPRQIGAIEELAAAIRVGSERIGAGVEDIAEAIRESAAPPRI